MLVTALPRLVVESQNAYLVDHESETILETVAAAGNRMGQLPNRDIGKPALAYDPSFTQEKPGPRVGIYTNSRRAVNAGAKLGARIATRAS